MIRYLTYARQNFNPSLNQEVNEYIISNFISILKPTGGETDGEAYFSYRLLTNIVRLSQAIAKIRLSNEVSIIDAQLAVNILLDSLKKQGIITSEGLFDFEKAEGITPKRERDKMYKILSVIKELQSNNPDKLAAEELIVAKCSDFGIIEREVDEILEKLSRTGDIIQPRPRNWMV